jgi:hypothetical protein
VPQTFIAVDPVTGRRGLLVEVHPEDDGAEKGALVADLSRRLFDRSIRVGIIFTPLETLVVRDRVTETSFTTNRFDVDAIPTRELLEFARLGPPCWGPAFYEQVRTWLEAVGSSWYSFLWPDAARAMVPDVVGHLAPALLETWDGLLERGDAA